MIDVPVSIVFANFVVLGTLVWLWWTERRLNVLWQGLAREACEVQLNRVRVIEAYLEGS